jgi:hypothetical protein
MFALFVKQQFTVPSPSKRACDSPGGPPPTLFTVRFPRVLVCQATFRPPRAP